MLQTVFCTALLAQAAPVSGGIPNPLFAADNTLMYFADGKKAVLDLAAAVKSL